MKKVVSFLTSRSKQIVRRESKFKDRYIYFFAFLSICALSALYYLPINNNVKVSHQSMISAAEKMKKATEFIRNARQRRGLPINPTHDPNQTGLIGRKNSEITTTLGDLEAKRTTTNPNFAALMVILMKEAGVKRGDRIAVGPSGSFPAATIAALCAAEQIGAQPTLIYSLGSSMWGANIINMTLLDMHEILRHKGILPFEVKAASIGGENDIGSTLNEEARNRLKSKIEDSDAKLIFPDNIHQSVQRRMEIYESASMASIEAFINVGGSAANMGTSNQILQLEAGINNVSQLPPPDKRGVIFAMAAKDIPIIHILNIKGLSLEYQLPWDPTPLPLPGEGKIFDNRANKPKLFWLLFSSYFGLLTVGAVFYYLFKNTGSQR